jgi:hypothetical protein
MAGRFQPPHRDPADLGVWGALLQGPRSGPSDPDLPWCMECASTIVQVEDRHELGPGVHELDLRCAECGWNGAVDVGEAELAAWLRSAVRFARGARELLDASASERGAARRAA